MRLRDDTTGSASTPIGRQAPPIHVARWSAGRAASGREHVGAVFAVRSVKKDHPRRAKKCLSLSRLFSVPNRGRCPRGPRPQPPAVRFGVLRVAVFGACCRPPLTGRKSVSVCLIFFRSKYEDGATAGLNPTDHPCGSRLAL